jgi:hypothetical protein
VNHTLKVYNNGSSYDVVVEVGSVGLYPNLAIRSQKIDTAAGFTEQVITDQYDTTGKTNVTPTIENHIITDNNGNVGIGTATPASGTKLDVNGNINIAAGSGLKVGGTNQVVGARRTGWTNQSATASRANLGTNPTTAALSSFCRALYDDLKAHGLIGN